MIRAALCLAMLSTAGHAGGYGDHHAVTAFRERPCTEVVGAIDAPAEAGVRAAALAGLYFGFVVGFDQANGGLQGNETTTLVRLRKACAGSPQTPALDLLRGFNN